MFSLPYAFTLNFLGLTVWYPVEIPANDLRELPLRSGLLKAALLRALLYDVELPLAFVAVVCAVDGLVFCRFCRELDLLRSFV